MSSGFHYKTKSYPCTNGIAELFFIKIIKYVSDHSPFLDFAIQNYRSFFPGWEVILDDAITSASDKADWATTIGKAISDIKHCGEISEDYRWRLHKDGPILIDLCT
ncbi:MAG TPA: hypothetical protein VHX44_19975 [Planctomycetota bacterium]|nr:hypothetical protein [Planctomycetota bacterium]